MQVKAVNSGERMLNSVSAAHFPFTATKTFSKGWLTTNGTSSQIPNLKFASLSDVFFSPFFVF